MKVHDFYVQRSLMKRTKRELIATVGVDVGNEVKLQNEFYELSYQLECTPGVIAHTVNQGCLSEWGGRRNHLVRVFYDDLSAYKRSVRKLSEIRLDILARYREDIWVEHRYLEFFITDPNKYDWDGLSLKAFSDLSRKREATQETIGPAYVQSISDELYLDRYASWPPDAKRDSRPLTPLDYSNNTEDASFRLLLRENLPNGASKGVFEIKLHNWATADTSTLVDVGIMGCKEVPHIIKSMQKTANEYVKEHDTEIVFDFLILDS